jgi:hypothetical protein
MSGPPYLTAAILSALVPGLGQAIKGHSAKTAEILLLGLLIAAAGYLGFHFEGPFSPVLLFLLTPLAVLLWWSRQLEDAYFAPTDATLFSVLPRPSRGSLDIQIIGFLFLFAVYSDLYIIQARPEYELKILGSVLPGVWGFLAKAQSPILHAFIAVGLISLKRWGLFLYLVYAAWGIINAGVNLAVLPPPHRIRIIFMISLAVFTAYLLWRRKAFRPSFGHSEPFGDAQDRLR